MKHAWQIAILVAALGMLILVRGMRNATPGGPAKSGTALTASPPAQVSGRAQIGSRRDLRHDSRDRLEPYGATNVDTPAFQRLADEGIVYEHAYAVAPLTWSVTPPS
jgi:hypothetical protein